MTRVGGDSSAAQKRKTLKNPKTLFLGGEGVNYSQIFMQGLKT
jgi:hypothetical protein